MVKHGCVVIHEKWVKGVSSKIERNYQYQNSKVCNYVYKKFFFSYLYVRTSIFGSVLKLITLEPLLFVFGALKFL